MVEAVKHNSVWHQTWQKSPEIGRNWSTSCQNRRSSTDFALPRARAASTVAPMGCDPWILFGMIPMRENATPPPTNLGRHQSSLGATPNRITIGQHRPINQFVSPGPDESVDSRKSTMFGQCGPLCSVDLDARILTKLPARVLAKVADSGLLSEKARPDLRGTSFNRLLCQNSSRKPQCSSEDRG